MVTQGGVSGERRSGVSRYDSGLGVTKNRRQAVHWYSVAASYKDGTSANLLGEAYRDGLGIAADKSEAVRWFKVGAELGDPGAQLNFGWCLHNGFGVGKNLPLAVSWYRRAARARPATTPRKDSILLGLHDEEARACCNLGLCYLHGDGVRRDRTIAIKWFHEAVRLGNGRACVSLGDLYRDGLGVSKDVKRASKLFRLGAERNVPAAFGRLADLLIEEGGAKKAAKAVELFRKAAKAGDAFSQYRLGVMYRDGLSVKKNRRTAAAWLSRAAKQGLAHARRALAALST